MWIETMKPCMMTLCTLFLVTSSQGRNHALPKNHADIPSIFEREETEDHSKKDLTEEASSEETPQPEGAFWRQEKRDEDEGISNRCIWLSARWGKTMSCPKGYLATGACGSSGSADCGNNIWTKLKCCEVDPTLACPRYDIQYTGNTVKTVRPIRTWQECSLQCDKEPTCYAWALVRAECFLKNERYLEGKKPYVGPITGKKHCYKPRADSEDCPQYDRWYHGNTIRVVNNIDSWEKCGLECGIEEYCHAWSLSKTDCYLKNKDFMKGLTPIPVPKTGVKGCYKAKEDSKGCSSGSQRYGKNGVCPTDQPFLTKLCGSGGNDDCADGKWITYTCCGMPNYNIKSSECRWKYESQGKSLSCPHNQVVTGRCGSGRNADCKDEAGNKVYHGIRCCPFIKTA